MGFILGDLQRTYSTESSHQLSYVGTPSPTQSLRRTARVAVNQDSKSVLSICLNSELHAFDVWAGFGRWRNQRPAGLVVASDGSISPGCSARFAGGRTIQPKVGSNVPNHNVPAGLLISVGPTIELHALWPK